MKFPTNIRKRGNRILVRGYKNGKYFKESITYSPFLFTKTSENSEFRTIDNKSVKKKFFNTIKDANDYIKLNEDLEVIYGLREYEYVYYYETYKEGFEYDFNLLNIVSIDIETDSAKGFASVELADREITAITLVNRGKSISFGYFDYESTDNKIYVQCDNEIQLLERFIKIWNTKNWLPDIITGWNSAGYDIPYIVNRIKRLMGEDEALKLSPFGFIYEKTETWRNGKEFKTYDIGGISHIDYFAAYLKFAKNSRESYKLDFIAHYELGEKKVDYSQYGSLDSLYRNNFSLFMDYNIHDALLIEKLENKLHYIQQMVSIAFVQRVNIEQTLKTVKAWDIMIHNHLMDQKIVIPPLKESVINSSIMGGYVCDPKKGMYDWVCSIDFTSLYPSLAIQYNISPDSYVQLYKEHPSEEEMMYGDISKYTQRLQERNCCMATNGAIFKREKRGFFPEILKKFFDGRKIYKNKMKELKKQLKEKPELDSLYHKYDNLQVAYKLIGNSGYGAFLNPYFRWFSNALGEGITSSGQMTTKYICQSLDKHLNELFNTEGVQYVIYWDTDSAYVHMNEAVKQSGLLDKKEIMKFLEDLMNREVVNYVNSICKDLSDKLNAYELVTSVKLEKICPRVIWTGSKHYIMNVMYSEGVINDPPEQDVVGMETVKSTTPKVCKDALQECYDIIMNDTQEKLFIFLNKFKEKFKTFTFEELSSGSAVNTLNKTYEKGVPIYTRAARLYNQKIDEYSLNSKYEKIYEHDKIKYCYLKTPNPFMSNIMAIKHEAPKEFELDKWIDYELQYDRVFLGPLRNVTDAVGWRIENTLSLDDCFG